MLDSYELLLTPALTHTFNANNSSTELESNLAERVAMMLRRLEYASTHCKVQSPGRSHTPAHKPRISHLSNHQRSVYFLFVVSWPGRHLNTGARQAD
jgi:hypothetical protein